MMAQGEKGSEMNSSIVKNFKHFLVVFIVTLATSKHLATCLEFNSVIINSTNFLDIIANETLDEFELKPEDLHNIWRVQDMLASSHGINGIQFFEYRANLIEKLYEVKEKIQEISALMEEYDEMVRETEEFERHKRENKYRRYYR